ncbi:MAG: methyltransferase domain-containing protein [Candidatus Eremiobacteraeota bacterium]|nr:methyltransferase domain-containing protein [Candidatus Eremiobacteraeota bacterium]
MNSPATALPESEFGKYVYSAELFETIEACGIGPGASVLDLGCGVGFASEHFVRSGCKVIGVDQSEAALQQARERLPAAKWHQAPVEKLPLRPATVDLVVCGQAFHYFDRTKAMNEVLRVLKPGGHVAIWWKALANDDPIRLKKQALLQEFGAAEPTSGLTSGFREFFAAPFADHKVRVLRWQLLMPLDRYLAFERTNWEQAGAFGPNVDEFFSRLSRALRVEVGKQSTIPLNYIQMLYLGTK